MPHPGQARRVPCPVPMSMLTLLLPLPLSPPLCRGLLLASDLHPRHAKQLWQLLWTLGVLQHAGGLPCQVDRRGLLRHAHARLALSRLASL